MAWFAAFVARRRGWPLLLAALLAALLAFAWWMRQPAAWPDARPALWRVWQGDRQAWLFGTIHAVPAGARWLSPAIERAARQSDVLLLEVTGLARERRDRAVFESLGRSPGLPPLAARLDPPDRARLAALARKSPEALAGLDGYESWAAALLIGAAASGDLGLTDAQAGETRFAALFADAGKPVLGLETVRGQLGLFDRLGPADQALLLRQALREAADAPRLYGGLYQSWGKGDLAALERQYLAPLAQAPGLRAALLDRRNAAWARAIDARLRAGPRMLFVAVGAGHLLGSTGLPARLVALGWHVERVQ